MLAFLCPVTDTQKRCERCLADSEHCRVVTTVCCCLGVADARRAPSHRHCYHCCLTDGKTRVQRGWSIRPGSQSGSYWSRAPPAHTLSPQVPAPTGRVPAPAGGPAPARGAGTWGSTFSLLAQLPVVLPELQDELRAEQLHLGVRRQHLRRPPVLNDRVGLNVQIPVHPGGTDRAVRRRTPCPPPTPPHANTRSWAGQPSRMGSSRDSLCGSEESCLLFIFRGRAPDLQRWGSWDAGGAGD